MCAPHICKERFLNVSVIALYVHQWAYSVHQVTHFTLNVQTTDFSLFPLITTLRAVTLEPRVVFSITSNSVPLLSPLSQITSRNSLPWHSVGHHTPSVISNPTVSCSLDPSHTIQTPRRLILWTRHEASYKPRNIWMVGKSRFIFQV